MHNSLSHIFKGTTVVVGVGNILRGDDAFGPVMIERLSGQIRSICVDAGTAPENYLGKIAKEKPDAILILDAAHLDLSPGEYDVLRKEDIVRSGFTTHDLSPVMFIEYLEKETDAEIYMLAVQPENTDFGANISAPVEEAVNRITELIKETENA